MRKFLLGLSLVMLAAAPVVAHADTLTFNFTLVQQSGNGAFSPDNGLVVGTGSFTLTSTTPTPGLDYQAINQNNKTPTNFISSIDFMIDGLTFDLADAGSNQGNPDPTKGTNATDIKFNSSGVLTQILYTSSLVNLTFNGNGGLNYTFSDGFNGDGSNGSVHLVAASVAPEPSSLILFGTGTLALAAFSRKLYA